ncbi:MAG: penicillin-binding transpeptidase domain-containing protein [Actinomycetota bacterium]|nr:penicillin-binding transpeptidase domain-containing protein [Actinomycetota bacterium]
MNKPLRRLFLVFVALFAVLVGFTSWWTVFGAEDLEEEPSNRRPLLKAQRIPRGLILASDGTKLATNRRTGNRETKRYYRVYPQSRLFSHAVGYSYVSRGSAGIERSYNDELIGEHDELESIIDQLGGGVEEGDDVHTHLHARAQRTAIQALGGQRGSIVALDPETGAVRVMVSLPDFDPNAIPREFSRLNRDSNSPLFNRATQARYPPGSTFKVVTAAAALDSGRYNPGSIVDGRNGKPISGVPLQNSGGADFGAINLTDALTQSVNTVWGEVGEKLGKGTMLKYMERFGFLSEPPLDYPRSQITPSGIYKGQRLLDEDDAIDIGRVAIGQERLQVTPLQMAMVAATVGNGGVLMRPRIVDRVIEPDGSVRGRVRPKRQARVMSEDAANELRGMMSQVVEEGTGTASALSGIRSGGKTGTAEVDNAASNQAWFIAFAPLDDPKVAIAVTVERTQGQGGTVAAPIAKQVMQALLGEDGG